MCGDIFISTLRGCARNSNFDAKELIVKIMSTEIIIHQVVDVRVSGLYIVYPACCLFVSPIQGVIMTPLLHEGQQQLKIVYSDYV